MSRKDRGPDSSFSLEPDELKELVKEIRTVETALGKASYTFTGKEKASRAFRRSLFVVKDIAKGEKFTSENVRSIRPGHGLPPKLIDGIIGKRAAVTLRKGTPLSLKMIMK
jgi:sialic acid synthase SpsE